MDLTVAIPAGATSICVSFGQHNLSTDNPGGVAISSIQANLHPIWSNAPATGVWDSSDRQLVVDGGHGLGAVTYSDGLPVTFDERAAAAP